MIAFPANDFGKQEPGTNDEIQAFCKSKGVSFRVLQKISVAPGKGQHPLYAYLTDESKNPQTGGPIRWNFDKFLVDGSGKPVGRYEPKEDPMGPTITADVEKTLKSLQ